MRGNTFLDGALLHLDSDLTGVIAGNDLSSGSIGIGAGTVALGIISDNLEARFGDDSLRYAILAGTGFYLVAAVLFLASAKRLAKDWEE